MITEVADEKADAIEVPWDQGEPDPRIYFAVERTLLAWVRTGLAMMGFGFVVSRFGLFMQQLALLGGRDSPTRQGLSMTVGITLVVLGVILTSAASARYWWTIQRLRDRRPLIFHRFSLGVITAVTLAILGAILAVVLVVSGLQEWPLPPDATSL